jgi:hypothetical protein
VIRKVERREFLSPLLFVWKIDIATLVLSSYYVRSGDEVEVATIHCAVMSLE